MHIIKCGRNSVKLFLILSTTATMMKDPIILAKPLNKVLNLFFYCSLTRRENRRRALFATTVFSIFYMLQS